MCGCAPASVVEGRQVVQLRLLSTYADAAEALNASLPGEVFRVDASPGFFTLFGSDRRVIVFCHWWLSHPHEHVVGDSSDESSVDSAIDSMAGRIAARLGYAAGRPDVALLAFEDGAVLGMETDSDYEPWSCTPQRVRSSQR